MESVLFLRLAVSRDKEGILALAQNGVEIQRPEDVIKSTYTLEDSFLSGLELFEVRGMMGEGSSNHVQEELCLQGIFFTHSTHVECVCLLTRNR